MTELHETITLLSKIAMFITAGTLIQKANTAQGFNSMSTVRLSVWEGLPEVKSAVDYICELKGKEEVLERRC